LPKEVRDSAKPMIYMDFFVFSFCAATLTGGVGTSSRLMPKKLFARANLAAKRFARY